MKKLITFIAFVFVACSANAQFCPDDNHPHTIDLGLPSGTKWACCNVGADSPEVFGGYYAWGETKTKSSYTWKNYKYTDINLGNDISGTQYDVAHVKWGGSWQMPTIALCKEMVDNCLLEYTSVNNVKGVRCTGHNGASIFIPAGGRRNGSNLDRKGDHGYYWSSSYGKTSNFAYPMEFIYSRPYLYDDYGYFGHNIRPICK